MKKCIIAVICCALITIVCTIATICGNINNSIGLYYDDYVGILASFIGACTTIMVGFQIASHLDIHDTKKQTETTKSEQEEIQKDVDKIKQNLSDISVLVSAITDNNIIKSLADYVSISSDVIGSNNANETLHRYKSLLKNIKASSLQEKRALFTKMQKMKDVRIPSDIDHYTEIIGLHAEILKTLEEAAKEQKD